MNWQERYEQDERNSDDFESVSLHDELFSTHLGIGDEPEDNVDEAHGLSYMNMMDGSRHIEESTRGLSLSNGRIELKYVDDETGEEKTVRGRVTSMQLSQSVNEPTIQTIRGRTTDEMEFTATLNYE